MDVSGHSSQHCSTSRRKLLAQAVTHLSRLYVNKTNGQEVVWMNRPSNWPKELSWKNPTSASNKNTVQANERKEGKDTVVTLEKKLDFLIKNIPDEILSDVQRKVFEDLKNGNVDMFRLHMCSSKWTDQIQNIISTTENDKLFHILLSELDVQKLKEILTKLEQNTSSLHMTKTSPRKRSNKSVRNKQCKKSKTEENKQVYHADTSFRPLLPKPSQEECNILQRSQILDKGLSQTETVVFSSSQLVITNMLQSSATFNCTMENTSDIDLLSPSLQVINFSNICNNSSEISSSEDVYHNNPALSIDSGTWSHQSSNTTSTGDLRFDEAQLNTEDVQKDLDNIIKLHPIENAEEFDPKQFMNFKDA